MAIVWGRELEIEGVGGQRVAGEFLFGMIVDER